MNEWVRDHIVFIDGEKRITPLYKCAACGRVWDGLAQCFPCEQDEEEEEEEEEPPLLKKTKLSDKRVAPEKEDCVDTLNPSDLEGGEEKSE